ncbi:MAG: hypothetical protein INR63_16255 [Actinomycetospora chiangmaiensis]|nr:hypothetical protein [Actinomycetospora chiangmaiensis]
MRVPLLALPVLAVLAAAALPRPASAETILQGRFGCHTQEVTDRLFKLVMAGDESGFGQLLRGSLASGECRDWKPGEQVRLESRSASFACIAPAAGQERCYWTPVGAIEKPN